MAPDRWDESLLTVLNDVLAAKPECAVYTALADNRLPDALEDYRRILAARPAMTRTGISCA